MKVVELQNVSKSFKAGRPSGIKERLLGSGGRRLAPKRVQVLDQISIAIEEGESTALLGPNGAGKSTLLKLLAGTIQPSSGTIVARGRVAPLLELGAGFHPDLTGRENIFLNASFLGVSKAFVRQRLDEIVDFSGIQDAIDNPVRFYSSGMYVRLGFAVAVHMEPDIVLVDEVLAVGDAEFQARSLARMESLRDEGRTIILVTHSLAQAQQFCSREIVLDRGKVVADRELQ